MIYLEKQYATIWKIETEEKYSNVRLTTSRKDKEGEYHNSNWSFVRFIGEAHDKVKDITLGDKEKLRIKITSGHFTNEPYEQDGEKKYPKNPKFVVFKFEFSDNKTETNSSKTDTKSKKGYDTPPAVDDEDDGVPF